MSVCSISKVERVVYYFLFDAVFRVGERDAWTNQRVPPTTFSSVLIAWYLIRHVSLAVYLSARVFCFQYAYVGVLIRISGGYEYA